MDERDFVNAILDDDDDEMPRLVFADWLEENGQSERAEWVRESCAVSKLDPYVTGHTDAVRLASEKLERCRPPCWNIAPRSGIIEFADRGLMWLEVHSKTSITRLGKLGWLPKAVEEGWVGWISVIVDRESAAQELVRWKGPARQVPLQLRLEVPLSEELLIRLADMPRLIWLELGIGALLTPSIERLADRQDIRTLVLQVGLNDFRFRVSQEIVSRLMDHVGNLDHLRILNLEGPRPNPGDTAFLARLARLSRLRRLILIHWPDLTVGALEPLKAMAGLRRLIVSRCPVSTDDGLRRVREALPSLQVERF